MTIQRPPVSSQWRSSHATPQDTSAQHALLAQETIHQFLAAFHLTHLPEQHPVRWLVWRLLGKRIDQFVQHVTTFDQHVGASGLQAGCTHVLNTLIRSVEVAGAEQVPTTGPLLLVANHPGLYDTLAVVAQLPRSDVRVVAAERPFWDALPNLTRHMLYVTDTPTGRLRLIRTIARHLREDGAVLTYPGGTIEPDPALFADAPDSLAGWSESVNLFSRLAPEVVIVPVVVGGVFDRRFLRHPLVFTRREKTLRRWLAATLQFVRPDVQQITIRVLFGQPVRLGDLHGSQENLTDAVLSQVHSLLAQQWRLAQSQK